MAQVVSGTAAALAELRSGQVGHETFALVTDVAKKVTRTGRYSTPSGSRSWARHDVEDLVGDFFADGNRAAQLTLDCEDDGHLRAKVATSLGRLIVGRLRSTPRGALWRRTTRRLSRRVDVHDVEPHHWALEGFASLAHWSEGRERLEAAAAVVVVDLGPEWDGERATPACTYESLDQVCDAVFNEARSPVEQRVVLTVVVDRVIPGDLDRVPADVVEDDNTRSDEPDPAANAVAVAEEANARAVAEQLFERLDDHSRALLPLFGLSDRVAAADPAVHLGKSAVFERRKALRLTLEAALDAAPDRTLLVRCLLDIQSEWQRATGHSDGVEP